MKRLSLLSFVAAAVVAGAMHVQGAEGTRLRHLASVYVDDKGAGLLNPEGVACGTDMVVVADTGNNRLLRFTIKDRTLSGGSEIKLAELATPTRVQVTARGDIYALDGTRRRVVHLGPDGTFRNAVSFEGAPPPATAVVKSFAIDADGALYVLDVFSARVLVVDAAGRFLKVLPLPAEAAFVTDVTVDALGTVIVLDPIRRRMAAATKDASAFTPLGGDLRASLASMPTSIVASRGVIFVAEGSGGSIATFGQDGTFITRQLTAGWKDGALDHPAQVCVTQSDEVFVADRGNSRVQVFGLTR